MKMRTAAITSESIITFGLIVDCCTSCGESAILVGAVCGYFGLYTSVGPERAADGVGIVPSGVLNGLDTGTDGTEATTEGSGSGVTDATVGSGVTDATVGSGVTETVGTGETDNPDAPVGFGVTEGEESVVTDGFADIDGSGDTYATDWPVALGDGLAVTGILAMMVAILSVQKVVVDLISRAAYPAG
jgi:hypothetical protein